MVPKWYCTPRPGNIDGTSKLPYSFRGALILPSPALPLPVDDEEGSDK